MTNSPPGSGRRIALAFPSMLPLGGAERVQIDLAHEFQLLGFAVDIVIADEPQDARPYFQNEVRIFTLGAPRIRSFIRPFMAYLRAERPDVVIASMWPFTAACVIAARLARTRSLVVVSDHNMLSAQYANRGAVHWAVMRASIALAYPLAAARVAVSAGVASDVARLGRLRPESVTVIHNPVSTQSIQCGGEDFNEVGDAWQGHAGARLLAVGRLKEQKNYPVLLRALSQLLQRRPAHLVILGTGPQEEHIRQLVRSSGLSEHVSLVGHVDVLATYYQRADLFILSSDYEGFGNVIVEAMSYGTPVVSTDCPSGPSEILEYGALGRLVPVGDASALAVAIEAELDTPHLPEDLKKRAADFSPAIAARRYLALVFPDVSAQQLLRDQHKGGP